MHRYGWRKGVREGKFKPPLDPFESEKKIGRIEAPLNYVEEEYKSASHSMPDEVAYGNWLKDVTEQQAHLKFGAEFRDWLVKKRNRELPGRGWGEPGESQHQWASNRPMATLPGVAEYLDSYGKAQIEFKKKYVPLAAYGPKNLHEAYLYWKYVQTPMNLNDASARQRFLDEYDHDGEFNTQVDVPRDTPWPHKRTFPDPAPGGRGDGARRRRERREYHREIFGDEGDGGGGFRLDDDDFEDVDEGTEEGEAGDDEGKAGDDDEPTDGDEDEDKGKENEEAEKIRKRTVIQNYLERFHAHADKYQDVDAIEPETSFFGEIYAFKRTYPNKLEAYEGSIIQNQLDDNDGTLGKEVYDALVRTHAIADNLAAARDLLEADDGGKGDDEGGWQSTPTRRRRGKRQTHEQRRKSAATLLGVYDMWVVGDPNVNAKVLHRDLKEKIEGWRYLRHKTDKDRELLRRMTNAKELIEEKRGGFEEGSSAVDEPGDAAPSEPETTPEVITTEDPPDPPDSSATVITGPPEDPSPEEPETVTVAVDDGPNRETLLAEIESLRRETDQLVRQRDGLAAELEKRDKSDKALEDARTQIKALEALIEEEKAKPAPEKDNGKIEQLTADLESKESELHETLIAHEEEREAHQREMNLLTKSLDAKEKEMAELRGELEKHKADPAMVSDLEKEIETLKAQIEFSEEHPGKSLAKVEAELEAKRGELAKAQEALEAQEARTKAAEEEAKTQRELAEGIAARTDIALAAKDAEMKKLRQERDRLEAGMKEAKEKEERILGERLEEIKALKAVEAEMKEEAKKHEKELEKMTAQSNTRYFELEKAKKALEEAKARAEQAEADAIEQGATLGLELTAHQETVAKRDKLQHEVDRLTHINQTVEGMRNDLVEKHNALLASMRKKKEEHEEQLKEKTDELIAAKGEIEIWKRGAQTSLEEKRAFKKAIKRLKTDVGELESKLTIAKGEREAAEERERTLKVEMSELTETLSKKETALATSHAETQARLERLKRQMESAKATELEDLRGQMSAEQAKATKTQEALKAEAEGLRTQILAKEAQVFAAETKTQSLFESRKLIEEELANLRVTHAAEKRSLKQREDAVRAREETEAEVDRLNSALRSSQTEVGNLKKRVDRLTEAAAELESLKLDAASLRSAKESLEEQKAELESQITNQKADLKRLNNVKTKLQQQQSANEVLKGKLDASISERDFLARSVEEGNEAVKEATEEKRKLTKKLSTAKHELQAAQTLQEETALDAAEKNRKLVKAENDKERIQQELNDVQNTLELEKLTLKSTKEALAKQKSEFQTTRIALQQAESYKPLYEEALQEIEGITGKHSDLVAEHGKLELKLRSVEAELATKARGVMEARTVIQKTFTDPSPGQQETIDTLTAELARIDGERRAAMSQLNLALAELDAQRSAMKGAVDDRSAEILRVQQEIQDDLRARKKAAEDELHRTKREARDWIRGMLTENIDPKNLTTLDQLAEAFKRIQEEQDRRRNTFKDELDAAHAESNRLREELRQKDEQLKAATLAPIAQAPDAAAAGVKRARAEREVTKPITPPVPDEPEPAAKKPMVDERDKGKRRKSLAPDDPRAADPRRGAAPKRPKPAVSLEDVPPEVSQEIFSRLPDPKTARSTKGPVKEGFPDAFAHLYENEQRWKELRATQGSSVAKTVDEYYEGKKRVPDIPMHEINVGPGATEEDKQIMDNAVRYWENLCKGFADAARWIKEEGSFDEIEKAGYGLKNAVDGNIRSLHEALNEAEARTDLEPEEKERYREIREQLDVLLSSPWFGVGGARADDLEVLYWLLAEERKISARLFLSGRRTPKARKHLESTSRKNIFQLGHVLDVGPM
jgi:chromosome segregation ATPase